MSAAPIPLGRYRAARNAEEELPMPDRYGDQDEPEPHACNEGWLDRDADHPRPCLVCKPHLAPGARRARFAAETTPHGHPVDWTGRRARRRQQ
ncbi:hypothetical protein [Actinosynnema mirum]|uniref:Uncharacterized protein n=1 Tax=Actinosynnema mirum (strain ATCC 29888 / DSM 43827 / JCM 3225 / NBRC 14064 / NCIMB 13271 / NRRL B-12336 / IMRU 3971 / 101) TaxID=446462 RepID=C6WB92_ACTMD|nr:hypothetical protein [Actinosynnema mirum]ACU39383.1 hypothetical protein Amir_5565 [Actinosynnema mirum DSM 43827]